MGTDTHTGTDTVAVAGTDSVNTGLLGRLGGPASQRRTSSVVTWLVTGKSATTLLVRRRPASEPEEPILIALPESAPPASCWAPRLIVFR